MPTIGLFGTCGKSQWRKNFIETYDSRGISYYNPQVSDWAPENAEIEAKHLAGDDIILFPVTNETYGLGSLSEVGFSILNAINLNRDRFIVVFIEMNVSMENIMENEDRAADSLKSRILVFEHLKKLNLKNVFIVDSLEKMLKISLTLWGITTEIERIREGCMKDTKD